MRTMTPSDKSTTAVRKRFIDAQAHLEASFELAARIYRSGFKPTFIVGLWRGGSTVGIAVQECLEYLGVETDHIALRTSYSGLHNYPDLAEGRSAIRVHGMQYLLETLNSEDRLLLVDDVYSSGRSVGAVVDRLRQRLRRNLPAEIRTAAVWYRQRMNTSGIAPDYYLYLTDDWLVLPYELTGVEEQLLETNKPALAPLLERIRSSRSESR
ncbi:MAG: phosphoribosyltransferase family protein [Pseudomonadota bacterium]